MVAPITKKVLNSFQGMQDVADFVMSLPPEGRSKLERHLNGYCRLGNLILDELKKDGLWPALS